MRRVLSTAFMLFRGPCSVMQWKLIWSLLLYNLFHLWKYGVKVFMLLVFSDGRWMHLCVCDKNKMLYRTANYSQVSVSFWMWRVDGHGHTIENIQPHSGLLYMCTVYIHGLQSNLERFTINIKKFGNFDFKRSFIPYFNIIYFQNMVNHSLEYHNDSRTFKNTIMWKWYILKSKP